MDSLEEVKMQNFSTVRGDEKKTSLYANFFKGGGGYEKARLHGSYTFKIKICKTK